MVLTQDVLKDHQGTHQQRLGLRVLPLKLPPPCDEAVIQAAPAHGSKELKNTTRAELSTSAKSTGRWVLVATILGSSVAFIDGTVVNVALPVLQTELHATATDVQWVVEAYSLFLAALILVGGSLGDHFGRRRVFAIGVILFTFAGVFIP